MEHDFACEIEAERPCLPSWGSRDLLKNRGRWDVKGLALS